MYVVKYGGMNKRCLAKVK